MILVKNRELLIPENERYIGTIYDTRSENRQFRIPRFLQEGTDLSALTFRLDLQYPDNTKDTLVLDKEVQDEYILLTWNVTAEQVQQTGTIFIQMRAVDTGATVRWSSFLSQIYVEGHINTPGSYSGDLSELEQLEAQFDQIITSEESRAAAESARVTAENNRVAAENNRATAENARVAAEAARVADWQSKMDSGYFIGPAGPQGIQDTGESGITVPITGSYSLSVDANGDLWCTYDEGTAVPVFEYDSTTGDLWVIT